MIPSRVTLVEVGPRDGVVRDCLYAPGDQVGEGSELLRLQE